MTIAIAPTPPVNTQPLLLDVSNTTLTVTPEQFDRLCIDNPDFVIELRSATDNLKPLQEKMTEYQRLGVRLGLLIDPKNKQVEIYRPGQEPAILESPSEIDCGEVMPDFVLSMSRIF
jgi:Uma2 family endonuclease